jgi:hypothetical protein
MLQRYKLRLGDGTVSTVDLDGLRTGLTDSRAMVQIAGTQEWRPLREVLAEEEGAARLARALVPPQPRLGPTSAPEAPAPRRPVEPSIGEPPLVQALADEPAAPGTTTPPWRDSREAEVETPVIRLKPLDDEPPSPYIPPRARMVDDVGAEEDEDETHDRLEGPLLVLLSTLGALLSRCLDLLTPLVRGGPATPRKPAPAVAVEREALSDRFFGWAARLTGWVGRLTARGRPEPPAPPAAAPRRPQEPAPPPPLAAPVPVSKLPVLRFADTPEEREVEDVYDGEEPGSSFATVWFWAVRVVLVGALVTGGVLAARHWDTWFPRAAELGQTVFTEIDRKARSSQRAEEQQRALRAATERLPHLAPDTIRLVLSASGGVLDPPEVFQLASEAADRGQGALTAAEAAELRALQRELLGNLRPPERARVADYERARARRVVFPFENPHVLELVARGARAMPPPSRERLQELLGRAVAAGLAVPAASPGVAPADAGVAR